MIFKDRIITHLKNKIVFFDLDGTLCEYKFGKHSNLLNAVSDEEFIEYCIKTDAYEEIRPLKTMQDIINRLDNEKVYIVTQCFSSFEFYQKINWLKREYPTIKVENIIFVADKKDKLKVLQGIYDRYRNNKNTNYTKSQFVLVDDTLSILSDIEEQGKQQIDWYSVIHISSFIE